MKILYFFFFLSLFSFSFVRVWFSFNLIMMYGNILSNIPTILSTTEEPRFKIRNKRGDSNLIYRNISSNELVINLLFLIVCNIIIVA